MLDQQIFFCSSLADRSRWTHLWSGGFVRVIFFELLFSRVYVEVGIFLFLFKAGTLALRRSVDTKGGLYREFARLLEVAVG